LRRKEQSSKNVNVNSSAPSAGRVIADAKMGELIRTMDLELLLRGKGDA
jgi:hypothetical protein